MPPGRWRRVLQRSPRLAAAHNVKAPGAYHSSSSSLALPLTQRCSLFLTSTSCLARLTCLGLLRGAGRVARCYTRADSHSIQEASRCSLAASANASVPSASTDADTTRRHRRASLKCHPDRVAPQTGSKDSAANEKKREEATREFQRVADAFFTLSDSCACMFERHEPAMPR